MDSLFCVKWMINKTLIDKTSFFTGQLAFKKSE